MAATPQPSFRRILVLCEGNHCRSPLAEVLLRAELPGIAVESAGLDALEGVPAAEEARRLLAARGLDLSAHRGRQLTPELGLAADLVLVMSLDQKALCEQRIPSLRGRVFLLGQWLPQDRQEIADPHRRGAAAFQTALDHIDQAVAAWRPRLVPQSRNA